MSLNPETLPSEITSVYMLTKNSTSNENSTVIDLKDFAGKVAVTLSAGVLADNASTVAVTLYDGAESNGANAATTGIAFSTITGNVASSTIETVEIDTRETDRYLKAVIVHGGSNASGGPISITASGYKQVK